MVTLYFHLREQIAKRLHYGLSDILVNTLTDVRELKNYMTHDQNNDFVHLISIVLQLKYTFD